MPGHLTSRLTTKLGSEKDGKLIGQYYYARPDQNLAGDVNGDKLKMLKLSLVTMVKKDWL